MLHEQQLNNQHSTWKLWNKLYEQVSPHSNTGKTEQSQAYADLAECYKDYPLQETVMLLTESGVKPVLIRRPAEHDVAVIDWLNVTLAKSTFSKDYDYSTQKLLDNDYYITRLDHVLRQTIGYGIADKMPKGIMYYQESYTLENECGHVCIGGQQDTILISLNGTGCTLGKYGWEHDLHDFLTSADRAKITRIDYAYDDLDGSTVSVDWANKQDDVGGFTCHRVSPTVEHRGNWKRPDGNGRTIYIGKRTSSKFCRIYEKGRQLGDKTSEWIRVEVEYKSKHFYIPLSALLDCSEHFLSAYPCFHAFDAKKKAVKFETIRQKTEIVWEKAIEIVKHQFGKYLHAFREYYNDDGKVLDLLKPKKLEKPKRLKPLYVDYTQSIPPQALPT